MRTPPVYCRGQACGRELVTNLWYMKSTGVKFIDVLQTLLCLKQRSVHSLTSLYNIRSLNVSCNAMKQRIWEYNVFEMLLVRDIWFFYSCVSSSSCFMNISIRTVSCFFVMFLYCCTLYVCSLCAALLCVINDDDNGHSFLDWDEFNLLGIYHAKFHSSGRIFDRRYWPQGQAVNDF